MTQAMVSPDRLPCNDTNNYNDLKAPLLLPALVNASCGGVQLPQREQSPVQQPPGDCVFRSGMTFRFSGHGSRLQWASSPPPCVRRQQGSVVALRLCQHLSSVLSAFNFNTSILVVHAVLAARAVVSTHMTRLHCQSGQPNPLLL